MTNRPTIAEYKRALAEVDAYLVEYADTFRSGPALVVLEAAMARHEARMAKQEVLINDDGRPKVGSDVSCDPLLYRLKAHHTLGDVNDLTLVLAQSKGLA